MEVYKKGTTEKYFINMNEFSMGNICKIDDSLIVLFHCRVLKGGLEDLCYNISMIYDLDDVVANFIISREGSDCKVILEVGIKEDIEMFKDIHKIENNIDCHVLEGIDNYIYDCYETILDNKEVEFFTDIYNKTV